MNKTDILNAINSGQRVVSLCNTKELKVINEMLYFFIVGTFYSMSVKDDSELNLYSWKAI
jgi:hypothetical protein